MTRAQKIALALAAAVAATGGTVAALNQDKRQPWAQRVKLAGACSYRASDAGTCAWVADGGLIPLRYVAPGWAVEGPSCIPTACIQDEKPRVWQ